MWCKQCPPALRGGGGYLVYWGLTPQQQPGSYQGIEMMMMESVFWYLRQITDETLHIYGRGVCEEYSLYARDNDENYGQPLSHMDRTITVIADRHL